MFSELREVSEKFTVDLVSIGRSARKQRGRPKRAARVDPAVVEKAPFPELVLLPADELYDLIRSIGDLPLLEEAFRFERAHESRRSVLRQLGRQMRALGWTEDEPIPGYDDLMKSEITARLRNADPDTAERVLCYELRNQCRRWVLNAALPRTVKQGVDAEFMNLSTTPSRRGEVKTVLGGMDDRQLQRAHDYEERTKRRVVMLRAIRDEIRSREA